MTDEIKPALTPEEWSERANGVALLPYADGQDRAAVDVCGGIFTVCFYGPGPRDYSEEEHGVPCLKYEAWLNDPGQLHALAAHALHGQEFGFTHDDVTALRWAANGGNAQFAREYAHLRNIAARIAALLPPAR